MDAALLKNYGEIWILAGGGTWLLVFSVLVLGIDFKMIVVATILKIA